MTIAAGEILDKYELIEQVGRGGMAVVYRGLDRSLKREVAVKILHRHLADSEEARERFEREAHAVAKLRHENILEIFDFSGRDSDESYIVTEFIEGPTLRDFIDDYQVRFPEVGAMVGAHLCRALGHAHGLGVLHRDVKPENIMIRSDGVVKLTDFGIAQILENERLTVTGQLLGSPAYMAPEHVEGRPLDFRTDVFAVGIVLYQLVVGELPFRGRNPHEILKRIADCQYEDPRKANPRVGNELGRIINRALARDPDDRFADITEMEHALERYLAGSGINAKEIREELGRFFASPPSYEMALRERLLAHLTSRGRALMDSDRVAALQLFDRVLNIEPDNAEVLAIIAQESRRRRWLWLATLAGSACALLTLVLVVWMLWPSSARDGGMDGDEVISGRQVIEPGDRPGEGVATDAAVAAGDTIPIASAPGDAGVVEGEAASAMTLDGGAATASGNGTSDPGRKGVVVRPSGRRSDRTSQADAGAPSPVQRTFTLVVFPIKETEYRIAGGAWQPVSAQRTPVQVSPGAQEIEVRNQKCCQSRRVSIAADDPGGQRLSVRLGFLPATVTPECAEPGVRVQIDGKTARLDKAQTIPMSGIVARKVAITFIGRHTDTQTVKVRYNDAKVVTCNFD